MNTDGSRRFRTELLPSAAALSVMAAASAVGFRGAFSDWTFVVAAIIGAAGSVAIALVADWRRLLAGEALALSLLGFGLLGVLVAGPVPGLDAARSFADGLVGGWADILSSTPPAEVTPELRVLPFAVAWLGGLIGGEILRMSTIPALPSAGPLVGLVLSLLFTLEDRSVALFQGVCLVSGALVLAVLQQRLRAAADEDETLESLDAAIGFRGRRRAVMAGATLVGIGVVAPVLGPSLPLADANDRFDLRDYQEPPWDPLDAPSPLAELKGSLLEVAEGDVVFRVAGETPVSRWRVATLASFSGVVWQVADPAGDAAAEFRPVDVVIPGTDDMVLDDTTAVEHQVEIVELGGHWLPTAGWPDRIEVAGGDADIRFNDGTGTLASPESLREGFGYRVTSYLPPAPTDAELLAATMLPTRQATDLELLPPPVRNLAADIVEGVAFGWSQVAALRNRFVDLGFYSEEETPPGHSYRQLGAFLEDPDRLVGFEEQYAAAAAVLARVAEVPARVVVGYIVPEDRWQDGTAEVLAGDISAWIEVRTEEYGWIPVDVTPERDRAPEEQEVGVTIREVAVPNPPPPPPPPPDVQPPAQEQEEVEEEDEDEEDQDRPDEGGVSVPRPVAVAGVVVGVPALLFGLFAAVVVGWKVRRMHRRRRLGDPALRVAGAWLELIDRFEEAGLPRPRRLTPREVVEEYMAAEPDARHLELHQLAREVDRAAYHPQPPDDVRAAAAWDLCDEAIGGLLAHRTRRQRAKARLDPTPLIRREPDLLKNR